MLGSVPVDPDASTARRWARDELADPVYHHGRSLLERLLDWVDHVLDGIGSAHAPTPVAIVSVLGGVALVVVVAFLVAGPVRRNRRAPGRGRPLLDADDRRTAAQLRSAADAAAARGDWSTAVVERFRATVRELEERVILDEQPGRTAHEAVAAACARLPGAAGSLTRAGDVFDEVAYGHRAAGPADDRVLRDADAVVRAARPGAPAVPLAAVPR